MVPLRCAIISGAAWREKTKPERMLTSISSSYSAALVSIRSL